MDDDVEEEHAILCRACGLDIADRTDVFPGSRTLEVNPHGYLHELITTRRARNLVFAGRPSAEASWFAGTTWDIASCCACGLHLGWRYEGAASGPFYGLRVMAIR
jgi:hypothetical protein